MPCEDSEEWLKIQSVLSRPLGSLGDLDAIINEFSTTGQTCRFFTNIPNTPEGASFDFAGFWASGAPLMVQLALEMPVLFADTRIPLLLAGDPKTVTLSHRQCACLLAHSAFGSITSKARQVKKEKWAFRAAQLFFLEATPSALCFLNYFKRLGQTGVPEGSLTIERRGFERGNPPWAWPHSATPLCKVEFAPEGTIETSPAEVHADFANKFIGGGCLENDFMMEEILFAIKPELIVSMALCSYMQDEEAIVIAGARQYSSYSGYGHSFTFLGDYEDARAVPATVAAMDALQGLSKIQFKEGLMLRDMNKARVAFQGARTVATGNWGCGAFGNDHVLKFLQQWLAASEAKVEMLYYHTFSDKRAAELPLLRDGLSNLTVGELWEAVLEAAKPGMAIRFRSAMVERAQQEISKASPLSAQQ
uniref:poly(ADP-ribose) glycohydrolase n=1 Tax=Arcella intermedia TaxID=1963864 RepID=A0A6B2L5L4_9EUKA